MDGGSLAAFGVRQAQVYRDTLLVALPALADGPDVPGSRPRMVEERRCGERESRAQRAGRLERGKDPGGGGRAERVLGIEYHRRDRTAERTEPTARSLLEWAPDGPALPW